MSLTADGCRRRRQRLWEKIAGQPIGDALLLGDALHLRYLFIDGAWRDHLSFAVTREDVPDGMLRRWHDVRPGPP